MLRELRLQTWSLNYGVHHDPVISNVSNKDVELSQEGNAPAWESLSLSIRSRVKWYELLVLRTPAWHSLGLDGFTDSGKLDQARANVV